MTIDQQADIISPLMDTHKESALKESEEPSANTAGGHLRIMSKKRLGLIAASILVITLVLIIVTQLSTPITIPFSETPTLAATSTQVAALEPEVFLAIDDLPAYAGKTDNAIIRRETELHTELPNRPRQDIVKYLVQDGDSLFEIAETFALKPESVLWGNWVRLDQDPHSLQPGQELDIPPVDGVLHTWSEGESLSAVADFFHVEVEDIIDWPGNHLEPGIDRSNTPIKDGTVVIVPGGRRDPPSWQMVSISRSNPAAASILGPGFCGSIYSGPVGTGVFDWPTSSTWLSGYYYIPGIHEAIDIGGSIGNAIYAADSGVIVYSGWNNYGYGYTVVIDHGNGWQTLYAHLNSINFGCGQAVFQGNKIGTMGVTGNSSGPHLHFEMRSDTWGRVNPANYLP